MKQTVYDNHLIVWWWSVIVYYMHIVRCTDAHTNIGQHCKSERKNYLFISLIRFSLSLPRRLPSYFWQFFLFVPFSLSSYARLQFLPFSSDTTECPLPCSPRLCVLLYDTSFYWTVWKYTAHDAMLFEIFMLENIKKRWWAYNFHIRWMLSPVIILSMAHKHRGKTTFRI